MALVGVLCAAAWIVATALSCATPQFDAGPGVREAVEPLEPVELPAATTYTERGDLQAILGREQLRILVPPVRARSLPRSGDTLDADLRLADELAQRFDVETVVIPIDDRQEMLDRILRGKGDIAIARLTATPERRARLGFSIPLEYVREVLVVREEDAAGFRSPADLDGVAVAVRESSSFHETLVTLKRSVPGLRIRRMDEKLDTEELLYRVSVGELDATVADEDLFREVGAYLPGLRAVFPLTDAQPIAWAIRPDSVRLKQAVDNFLQEKMLTRELGERALGDLDAIRRRQVLRVLTRNNAATYFLHRGKEAGFEFELVRRFAHRIGCRLQIVVPPSGDLLIPWLREGRGDLIAAALTVTPERESRVAFGRPYNFVREMLVVPSADETVRAPEDLAGRSVWVRPSSAYRESLEALSPQVGFEIVAAPEEMETEELVAAVGEGRAPMTVADSNILDIELTYRADVRAAFEVGQPRSIAWAVRPEDTLLLMEVDRFFRQEYRGQFFNVLKRKYFDNPRRVADLARNRSDREGRISAWDEIFRRHGSRHEIDWRLLAAVAAVESEFDPEATSWVGAVGLMQVMPQTAAEVGMTGNLYDPDNNIAAGAGYLRRLIDGFDPGLEFSSRVRFALGAYNAGAGHIADGRRLAREHGLDPDRWFGHVATVIPLLARGDVARRARYGYCRCRETAAYVRKVNDHYAAYARVFE